MKWSQPADRAVVEAVVAVFREPVEQVRDRLLRLSARQWARSYYWLDSNGMALYLLAELEKLGLERELPDSVSARFQINRVDSRDRCTFLYAEFADLNRAFQSAGVRYSNLKGLTLAPDSCPDPALRCQLDFDFLVDFHDLHKCKDILTERGYDLRHAGSKVWEFKTNCDIIPRIEDLYKPRAQRLVELHFKDPQADKASELSDERLDRLRWRSINGLSCPCLQPPDELIEQANHIFHHLCGTATRLAWLLEFRRHVAVERGNASLWTEVLSRATSQRTSSTALGVTSLVSRAIFGDASITLPEERAIATLPVPVRLWAEHYGSHAVLANAPGTKLYLLLKEQLMTNDASWPSQKRRALLPLHGSPRVIQIPRHAGWWKILGAHIYRLRFVLFRLRFHLVEGLRYKIESMRWKRHLAVHGVTASTPHSPKPFVINS